LNRTATFLAHLFFKDKNLFYCWLLSRAKIFDKNFRV